MQAEYQFLERDRVALRWYHDEFCPAIELLKDAGLVRRGETQADAYARLSAERYRLMRSQAWTDEVLERLRGER
jgi:hypothetical protein